MSLEKDARQNKIYFTSSGDYVILVGEFMILGGEKSYFLLYYGQTLVGFPTIFSRTLFVQALL